MAENDKKDGVQLLGPVAVVIIGLAGFLYFQLKPPGASPRPKTAKAQSEMRNLAVSIETYRIDHNAYPPAVDPDGKIIPFSEDGTTVSSGYISWPLSTPISYAGSIPKDPFHVGKTKSQRELYRYATNGVSCWIMMSYGPDQDEDIAIEEFPSFEGAVCDLKNFLSHFGKGTAVLYDSTNGVTSSGDIIKTGP